MAGQDGACVSIRPIALRPDWLRRPVTQAKARIHQHWPIEHATFTDESGFKSFRSTAVKHASDQTAALTEVPLPTVWRGVRLNSLFRRSTTDNWVMLLC